MSSTLYEREGPSCVDERFDVFSYPLVESAIERTFESEFLPETTLSDKTKQILIKIDPLPNFVDLSSISTEITVKITLGNGNPLPPIVPVTTTAIMLATSTTNSISKKKLSSRVTSSLDKTPISSISSQYHLRNNRTSSKKRHDSATSESSLNSNTSNEYHLRKRKRDEDQMGGWTDEWADGRAEKKKENKKRKRDEMSTGGWMDGRMDEPKSKKRKSSESNLNSNEYYLRKKKRIEGPTKGRTEKKRKKNLTADPFAGCGFSQMPATLIFREMDISLNGQSISSTLNTYNMLCYLETLTNYSQDCRQSKLERAGWFDDVQVKTTDLIKGVSGFRHRNEWTKESRHFTIKSGIYHGITMIDKFLMPMCSIGLNFYLADPEVVLKSEQLGQTFKYEILNFKLILKQVVANESFQLKFEEKLLKNPAIYNYNHLAVREFNIPVGLKNVSFSDVFQNHFLPTNAIIGITSQAAAVGDYKLDFFNFEPFSLQDIHFQFHNFRFPTLPFETNFNWQVDTTKYLRAFDSMLSGRSSQWSDNGTYFDRLRFSLGGYCLYFFDFKGYRSCDDRRMPKKIGQARLQLTFDNVPTEPLRLYLYTQSPVSLLIDSERQLHRNFTL